MSSELQAVLEIAAAGSTLLFAALAGLIGLMYLLTAPWLGARRAASLRPDAAGLPPDAGSWRSGLGPHDQGERARRERAVALAVAVARAEQERPSAVEGSSEWRRVHRARLMDRPSARASARRR
jgi:hypothetical protein